MYVPSAVTVAVAAGVLAFGAKVTLPGPLTSDQVPVPRAGALPARVATSVLQRCCAGPAFAAFSNVKVTDAFVLQNTPFAMVHFKTYGPGSDTVTVAFGVFAFGVNVAVPGPLTFVQVPVPTAGALPARVPVRVPQKF